MTKALISAGALVTLLSLILAYIFHYNHFFEFLILGLLLMLIPTAPAELQSYRKVILFGIAFLVGGLGVEFFGQTLVHMWYYNYSSLFEHVLLFAWGYPASGFILALSYLYARKVIGGKEIPTAIAQQNPVYIATIICVVSTILAVFFFSNLHSRFFIVLGLYSFVLASCGLLSVISEHRSGSSLIRDFLQNWRATLVATLLATYVFMLAQELPNLAAKQWAYTWQTGTIIDAPYLGIPLATWLLWPFLTLGTVAVLYAVRR